MAEKEVGPGSGTPYWPIALIGAVVAATAAVWITFSQNHALSIGLMAFGMVAVFAGAAQLAFNAAVTHKPVRLLLAGNAAVSVIIGIAALLNLQADLGVFLFLQILWAAIAGISLILASVLGKSAAGSQGVERARSSSLLRDWLSLGILYCVYAIVCVILPVTTSSSSTEALVDAPADLLAPPDATVVAVGFFGAFCVILAVYQLIQALSLARPGSSDTNPHHGSPTGPHTAEVSS